VKRSGGHPTKRSARIGQQRASRAAGACEVADPGAPPVPAAARPLTASVRRILVYVGETMVRTPSPTSACAIARPIAVSGASGPKSRLARRGSNGGLSRLMFSTSVPRHRPESFRPAVLNANERA